MRHAEIVHRMRTAATSQPYNRRTFVLGSSGVAGALVSRPLFAQTPSAPVATPVFGGSPFSLGIASGEPLADGVVLWTRLAPQPFEPNGGMPDAPVEVRWQVATDDAMRDVVQEGVALAEPAWGHSVHVEVEGLEANRWYWYRFVSGNEESPIGRTKTAPAAGADIDRFRFAFASCQRWDQGLYTAYRDLARQDVDLVVHLGDYIYEYNVGFEDLARAGEYPGQARTQPRNLEDYRYRYAMYKLDEHLQEAHRVAPWLVTWDDHEVYNNFFGKVNRDLPAAQSMLLQRAAAYQAYYEHMPLRRASRANGPDLQLFRHRTFGSLVEFNLLDTRQYRTSQAPNCTDEERLANDGFCSASLDPERSMLGERQRGWLLSQFDQATSRWNVLAQQVPFSRIDNEADPALASYGGLEMDKWDGYAYERDLISAATASAAEQKGFAPVVITGDVHANYVWDLQTDWDDTSGSTAYGTEFVGTSISSNGDEALEEDGGVTTECGDRNGNRHNHLYDNHRGYVLCDLTAETWESTYRIMPNVSDPDAVASTLVSFAVEHGRPGAQVATSCTPDRPAGA